MCFRKYEWKKHGTCAAKAISLNSQHKYFSKALDLYHTLDLDRYKPLAYLHVYTYAHLIPAVQSGETHTVILCMEMSVFVILAS